MKMWALSLACIVSMDTRALDNQDSGTDINEIEQAYTTVTFDANGGFCQPTTLYYALDEVYDIFPLASLMGHSLIGWMGFQATDQQTLIGYKTITTTSGGTTEQVVTPVYTTTTVYTPQGWLDEGFPVYPLANAAKAIWLPNNYTIRFNPNGGTGTMQDQEFFYGEAKSLRGCSFLRDDCEFVGWSRAGALELYEDGAIVSNLTSEADDVVTLFARWKVRDDVLANASNMISFVSTNVIVHYVTNSKPSDAVIPDYTAGIVNIIAEVDASKAVSISPEWAAQYPTFASTFDSDFSKALMMETGKKDGAGNPMLVWQDYVAGTDPTKEDDVFTASITFDKDTGVPVISWSPELKATEAAKRVYRKFGKVKLTDEWAEIPSGHEADYNFFKVTVEMK